MSVITSGGVDVRGLQRVLEQSVDGEVRFDGGSRAAYSTDASNFRQVPVAVVVPRTVDAAVDTIAACHRFGVPVLSRGGGTSLAGQCCNVAVVIDWSKYCNRLVSLDVDARTATVEPGIVLDELNASLAAHDVQFGPRPATHSRCTLGGMIGNNSCGSTAQAYGKTGDNVRRLEVLTYGGARFWAGPTDDREYARMLAVGGEVAELYRGLRHLVDEFADDIREGFVDIPRRVSGYNLDALLPENGFDVARALVGSESTLATVLRAELELVPTNPATAFAVFGFPSIDAAADAAPVAARFEPLAVEGLDDRTVNRERDKQLNHDGIGLLPDGDSWLIVEMGGESAEDAGHRVDEVTHALQAREPRPDVAVLHDDRDKELMLRVREAGLSAAARAPGRPEAFSGWEDAAVAPDRLGDYLREFNRLLKRYGYEDVALYGHFGQGCVHCRIPFDFTTAEGVDAYSRFLHDAARLVVSMGGSLSGEHGDGQSRGSLLPIMFDGQVMDAFRELKRLFDPGDRMNPGKVIDANPVTEDLRMPPAQTPGTRTALHFSFPDDGGDFAGAAARCVGVGQCRSHSSGVMCPSYRATGEEEHSTRGRARLLYEMMNGGAADAPVSDGWRSDEVLHALDLCLSCKGCKSDCPVDVDMATYKAEFLSHHFEGRVRPASHYTMGWLPGWAVLAHAAPWLVNAASHAPLLARIAKRIGGIEPDRPVPFFARRRFTDSFARGRRAGRVAETLAGDVVLWPDTFTNNFHPAVARAATRVLERAGYHVIVPRQQLCCGLTWISTGQLGAAERILTRTVGALEPHLRAGTPIVVLEPSCAAVFRSDAPELLPDDELVRLLAERTRTLAELLEVTDGWQAPAIDRAAVSQPHCHQHAVLGYDADQRILKAAGVDLNPVEGCCGLAGNFGFESGHLGVSAECAEHAWLPSVRGASDDTLVLADGFSCRTQLEHLGDGRRQALHLAELLDAAQQGGDFGSRPEWGVLRRPGRPQRVPRRAVAEAREREGLAPR